MSHKRRQRNFKINPVFIPFIAVIAIIAVSATAHAGSSWFSRVRHINSNDGAGGNFKPGDSNLSVFDVTVSLHNNPAGGGNQIKYEEIIQYWADAVCEQTNGAHKLGKIRLFPNGTIASVADVKWIASAGPAANTAGFGVPGHHIFFGDKFPLATGDIDMLAQREYAGYALGHEWGHYVYGVYDEYTGDDSTKTQPYDPQVGDIFTSPSIMSKPHNALGGGDFNG